MSEWTEVYGYVFTDADGNPRLPEVSGINPETNPFVEEPYRLIYSGHSVHDCVEAIKASIVTRADGRATWASEEVARSGGE